MLKRHGQALHWKLHRLMHRALHRLLLLVTGLAVLSAAAVVLLAMRLEHGPIQLGLVVRPLQAALNRDHEGWQVQKVSLAWEGWRQGQHHPLRLELGGLTLRDGGRVIVSAQQAGMSLWLPKLLLGHIAPRRLWISGGMIALRREVDGRIVLDQAPHPGGAPSGGGMPMALHYLRSISADGSVTLRDVASVMVWHIPDLQLHVQRQVDGSLRGQAHATLHARIDPRSDVAVTTLSLVATPQPQGHTVMLASVTPIDTGWLAAHIPVLKALQPVAAPISGAAGVTLDRTLAPIAYQGQATLGSGQVVLGDKTLVLLGAQVAAHGTTDHVWLDNANLRFAVSNAAPIGVGATGDMVSSATGRDIALHLTLDRLHLADLPDLWPTDMQRDARKWLTENLTDGVAHDAVMQARIYSKADFSAIHVVDLHGTALADGVVVHWLKPVPPLTDGKTKLFLRNPDRLDITDITARQGALQLRGGAVRITGLSQRDQDLSLQASIQGSAVDVLALLRHKKLGLLSRHPLPLNNPSGNVEGTLNISLPLKKTLQIDDLAIRGQAHVRALHLERIALSRDLDDGAIDLDVSNAGLTLDGTALLAGLPSHLHGAMNFRPGPQDDVAQSLSAETQGSFAQMREAGFDFGVMLGGHAALKLGYGLRRNGVADATVDADLQNALLGSDLLGWHKHEGGPARVTADFRLAHNQLQAIPSISAEGEGLHIQAHGDAPDRLDLARFTVGRTDANGHMRWDDGTVHVDILGSKLDLSQWLRGNAANASKAQATPLIVIDGTFDQLLLGGAPVRDLRVHLQSRNGMVQQLRAITSAPRGTMQISSESASRKLLAQFDDGGGVAHALGVLSSVQGGALTVSGSFDDSLPAHPLAGDLVMTKFRLHAPFIVKLAEAATVYGAPSALVGQGLAVERLGMGFRLENGDLQIQNAKLFNQVLGATASGTIDLREGVMDLFGVVVPAYFFNTLLGHLPVLGPLLAPPPGRGVFETSYTMRGRISDPKLRMNPLSTLAPRLFQHMDH